LTIQLTNLRHLTGHRRRVFTAQVLIMIDDWTEEYPQISNGNNKQLNDYLREDIKLSDEQVKEVNFYLGLHRQKQQTLKSLTDPDYNLG